MSRDLYRDGHGFRDTWSRPRPSRFICNNGHPISSRISRCYQCDADRQDGSAWEPGYREAATLRIRAWKDRTQ
jgi:hypothetical protein